MKIFIISNTLFGYKNITNTQIDYFNNIFISYLNDNYNDGDILVHGGNIFNNRKNVSMDIINDVIDIFEKMSKILPVYLLKSKNDDISTMLLSRVNNVNIIDNTKIFGNISIVPYNININDIESNDIIIFNSDYYNNPITNKEILKNKFDISICTTYNDRTIKDDNVINIGSPYQLGENDKEKKGFLLISPIKKKVKFVTNNHSPQYIKIEINSIDEINRIEINEKDYIILNINESLLNNKKNLNIINILINKVKPKKVLYFRDKKIESDKQPIEISNDLYNIDEMISEYMVKHDLDFKKEINNIINIYNESN